MQSAQALLVMAMGRITAAIAIQLTAMLATAIHQPMLATAIRLMAMAATTGRACALPAEWRSIGPVGAKGVGHTDRRANGSPRLQARAWGSSSGVLRPYLAVA